MGGGEEAGCWMEGAERAGCGGGWGIGCPGPREGGGVKLWDLRGIRAHTKRES